MIQTGDYEKANGTGGSSIWGKEFEDEFNPALKHDAPYKISMANKGPNTNGSQFFITTAKCPWLDGKHVVFGKVVIGEEIIKEMEKLGNEEGEVNEDIRIEDCGALKSEEIEKEIKEKEEEKKKEKDYYEKYPEKRKKNEMKKMLEKKRKLDQVEKEENEGNQKKKRKIEE